MYKIKSYTYNNNCVGRKQKLPDDYIELIKQLSSLPFAGCIFLPEPVTLSFDTFTIDGETYGTKRSNSFN